VTFAARTPAQLVALDRRQVLGVGVPSAALPPWPQDQLHCVHPQLAALHADSHSACVEAPVPVASPTTPTVRLKFATTV